VFHRLPFPRAHRKDVTSWASCLPFCSLISLLWDRCIKDFFFLWKSYWSHANRKEPSIYIQGIHFTQNIILKKKLWRNNMTTLSLSAACSPTVCWVCLEIWSSQLLRKLF
jgi:hypothetical protein